MQAGSARFFIVEIHPNSVILMCKWQSFSWNIPNIIRFK